ncbi:unnamed protein product [Brassica rapa subsp. trilocularis]
MANALVFLSDLQRGRSSSTLQVRLLRFWDPRNVGRGGDLMGVDMLLLDSQVNTFFTPYTARKKEEGDNERKTTTLHIFGFDKSFTF